MADYTKKELEAYLNQYPDLRDHYDNKYAGDLSATEWAERHYERHGSGNENRLSPEESAYAQKPGQQASSQKGASSAQKDSGDVFYGTNIPTAGYSSDQIDDFNSRLRADIGDGNARGANDVIFSIAYARGGGDGNARVGAVQAGVWKLDNGPRWAETSINSSNDEYRMRDEQGNLTGEVVRYSDSKGVMKGTPTTTSRGRGGTEATGNLLKDSEGNVIGGDALEGGLLAIDSWGQNAKAGIQGGQPTFQPSTGTQSIWTSYGDDPGWEAYFTSDPSTGPAGIQTPKADQPTSTGGTGDFTSGEKFTTTYGGGGTTGTGDMNLLAYRPGTKQYWDTYMGPKLSDSLMQYKMPPIRPAPLSYVPGEQRAQGAWENFLGMGGLGEKARKYDKQFQGHIPQGVWATDPARYADLTKTYSGAPWKFSAPQTAMVAQPAWTPYNITPAVNTQRAGLLGDWAAPALNTTNLLGAA